MAMGYSKCSSLCYLTGAALLSASLLACGDSEDSSQDAGSQDASVTTDSGTDQVDAGSSAGDAAIGNADMGSSEPDTGSGPVDITNAFFQSRAGDCAMYANSYFSSVTNVKGNSMLRGMVTITAGQTHCELSSNAIPNHDFNDGSARFATPVSEIQKNFTIPRNPSLSQGNSTALTLMTYDAVMLNGVLVDLLAAGCFGVGDGRIGCFDINAPWRYDPMSPTAGFGTDGHNAHTQPDGLYHYHGDPLAMYADLSLGASPVIGFAADGFPIYGPYFDDGTEIRAAVSGYTLRSGARPSGTGEPGGNYDGTFVDDYEYTGQGDLDECNGMTVDGQYGYYVTATYPWILGCLRASVDSSFNKRR